MTIGTESFEVKWASVENYVSEFINSDLDPAGFERKHLASLNLMTNALTIDQVFTAPDIGKQLIMRVETQTGAGITQSTINVQYVNQDTNTVNTSTSIGEGVALNHDTVVPFNTVDPFNPDVGVYSVASVINAGPTRSGVIGIYAPSSLNENFQGTWSAADVGL